MKRKIAFEPDAFSEFQWWLITDKKIAEKIIILIENISSTPFSVLGKPEPLKNQYKGYWSRRITDEHRLIYKVNDAEIIIIGCKNHYK